jgi:uncharacterized protein (TIGR01244 family)
MCSKNAAGTKGTSVVNLGSHLANHSEALEMRIKKPVTPAITIGDQPSEEDLMALAAEGYRGVINLRNDRELEQPLGTMAEGELVRSLGLDYLHYSVGSWPLSNGGVTAVFEFLDHHAAGKTLVHCRRGGRAQALVLLHQARTRGWRPDEVFTRGAAMGLALDVALKSLVEAYLNGNGRHNN